MFVLKLNPYCSLMCGQVMKVWRTTTCKTARWASSSMPSMRWPTGCTICTLTFVPATWGSVMPWSLLMEATYWNSFWRHPSQACPGRTYGSMRTAILLEGKPTFLIVLGERNFFLDIFRKSSLIKTALTDLRFHPAEGSEPPVLKGKKSNIFTIQ